MPYNTIIKNPVFGEQQVKIWATSIQSFNKYFSKTLERYNLLMNPELEIVLSPIEHIEIVRKTIKFYFQLKVTDKIYDCLISKHRIICNGKIIIVT